MSTGRSLSLIDSTIDGGPPRHMHRYEDESFFLLEGNLDVECGGECFEASTGSFVFLPRGAGPAATTVTGHGRYRSLGRGWQS